METRATPTCCAGSGFRSNEGRTKEFLTLWKDADPDIPILKQAKAARNSGVEDVKTTRTIRRKRMADVYGHIARRFLSQGR
jgi:hypothetical protein